MMRRQRKATPLIALLCFELAAIMGLTALGNSASMQVPWNEFQPWLQSSSIEVIAAPFIRLFALVVAYWMFVSTSLFAVAQLSRIPGAIRAVSVLTLPSVRRVVDGAVAVSLATTSLVGMSGTVASAEGAGDILLDRADQTDIGLVESPRAGTPEAPAQPSATAPTTSTSTTSTTEAPTTTSTEAPTTTSTEAPTTSSSTSTTSTAAPALQNQPIAPSPGDDFVLSPRPGQPAAPTTTTTTAPPAPAAPEPAQVLGAQEHKVVPGDNLWIIARDALASSSNRSPKDVSEGEIRDYWLKVIDENRSKLRSGDPHWIFPGEVISLPAVA